MPRIFSIFFRIEKNYSLLGCSYLGLALKGTNQDMGSTPAIKSKDIMRDGLKHTI